MTFSISVRDENDRVGAVQLRRFQRQMPWQERLSRGDGQVKCCAKCGGRKQGTQTGLIGQRSLKSSRITVGVGVGCHEYVALSEDKSDK